MLGVGTGYMSDALVNLSINEVLMATSQSVWLLTRKDVKISWKFVFNTLVWICSGVVLGVWTLEHLETSMYNVWLKRSLGLFLLLIACLRTVAHCFVGRKKRSGESSMVRPNEAVLLLDCDDPDAEENKEENDDPYVEENKEDNKAHTKGVPNLGLVSTQFAIAVSFFSAGILGGLYGVAGPPLMIFVLYYSDELEGDVWRTTCAVMRCMFSVVRLSYLVWLGEIGLTSHWIEFGCMITFGLVGLSFGNILSKHLKDAQFRRIILIFLICGSILMSTSGWKNIQEIAMVVMCSMVGIVGSVVLLKWTWVACRRKVKKEQSENELPFLNRIEVDAGNTHDEYTQL